MRLFQATSTSHLYLTKYRNSLMRFMDMLEILRIRMFGHQPVAKVSDFHLRRVVGREFSENADYVYSKLKGIRSETSAGGNRIAACVIKLANRDLQELDKYIQKANEDYRDVILLAEYPRMADMGFEDDESAGVKQLYIEDYKDYTNWLYQ